MFKPYCILFTLLLTSTLLAQNFSDDAIPKDLIKTNFYKDGKAARIKWYGDDQLIDSLKTYHKSGNLNEILYYKEGRFDGHFKQYNDKGNLTTEWIFSQGKLVERTDHILAFSTKTEERNKKALASLKSINKRITNGEKNFGLIFTRTSLRNKLGNNSLALHELKILERIVAKYSPEKNKKYHKVVAAIYDRLGGIYGLYDMENHAIQYKHKAIKASPKQSRLFHNLGSYLAMNGSYDLGIAYLNKAVEMVPNHSFAHWVLGITYSDLGKYEEAMEHTQIAFKNEKSLYRLGIGQPERDLRTTRGLLYHKLGETEKGIQDLQDALSINKENSFAMRNLGVVFYETEKYAQACELLNKSKSLYYESKHRKEDLQEYLDLACSEESKVVFNLNSTLPLVYPNPAVDFIEILNYDVQNFEYEIYAFDAKLVQKGTAQGVQLNISELGTGLYILKIPGKEKTISLRIIKN
ncbi:T9SS type A sorting domain-containing protein [Flavicella sediminum]|uniref:T9SS type A sorting domain-containing protein n=1 Tax=Flavicella sediminum TaxID=2585141 RepID=UPI001120442D|nr:T9SS type A sorting domain-containing protein [Flavicella sediminum]